MSRRYVQYGYEPYCRMGLRWCRTRLVTARSPWQYRAHWMWWHLRRDG